MSKVSNTNFSSDYIVEVSCDDMFDGPAAGRVIAMCEKSFVVKLLGGLANLFGIQSSQLVAQFRHRHPGVHGFLNGKQVLCNLTLVPDVKFSPDSPLDISWWRGGGAAVGAITRIEA